MHQAVIQHTIPSLRKFAHSSFTSRVSSNDSWSMKMYSSPSAYVNCPARRTMSAVLTGSPARNVFSTWVPDAQHEGTMSQGG